MSRKNRTSEALRRKVAKNRARPCRSVGCSSSRHSLSPWCGRHSNAADRWGHPDGRAIDPSEYATERKLTADFISRHSQHPGIVSALGWIQRWMDAANAGEADVPAQPDMQRLAVAGVSPLSILVETAALCLYSRRDPRRLPDDQRLEFMIGYKVAAMAPREKRYGTLKGKPRFHVKVIGKVARRTIGRRLRLTLAALLVNIAEGILDEREQQQAFAASLHQPFTTTPKQEQ